MPMVAMPLVQRAAQMLMAATAAIARAGCVHRRGCTIARGGRALPITEVAIIGNPRTVSVDLAAGNTEAVGTAVGKEGIESMPTTTTMAGRILPTAAAKMEGESGSIEEEE